jgi:hypothetical protein
MPISSSGQLDLSSIHTEIFGTSPTGQLTLKSLIDSSKLSPKTPYSINRFYGYAQYPVPTISTLSRSSAFHNQTVVVTGLDFIRMVSVKVSNPMGDWTASYTIQSTTQLTFTMPNTGLSPGTSLNLEVCNTTGCAVRTSALSYAGGDASPTITLSIAYTSETSTYTEVGWRFTANAAPTSNKTIYFSEVYHENGSIYNGSVTLLAGNTVVDFGGFYYKTTFSWQASLTINDGSGYVKGSPNSNSVWIQYQTYDSEAPV